MPIKETLINFLCGMKHKAHGAQKPRHIKRIVEVASTAQRSDSLAQKINQGFLSYAGKAAIAALKFYKRFISPFLPSVCRFEPTCSVYMREAIEKKGFVEGIFLGARRLLKCHPFHEGGFDPVP